MLYSHSVCIKNFGGNSDVKISDGKKLYKLGTELIDDHDTITVLMVSDTETSVCLDEDRVLTADDPLDPVAPVGQELPQLGVVGPQVGCFYH